MRSFRFRISFYNSIVSCVVLLSMAVFFLVVLYHAKLNELDSKIEAFAQLSTPHLVHKYTYREHGKNLDKSLQGKKKADQFSWLLIGFQNEIIYKSQTWPEDISPDRFSTRQIKEDILLTEPPSELVPPGIDRPHENDSHPYATPRFMNDNDPEEFLGPPRGPHPRFTPNGRREERMPPAQKIYNAVAQGHEFQFSGDLLHRKRIGIFYHDTITVVIYKDMNLVHEALIDSLRAFAISSPFILLIIIGSSYWFGGKSIKPIATLSEAINRMDADNLKTQITLTHADKEFMQLADAYNEMIGRLRKSFYQAQRFSSDAAHELKTPLTILQGEIDNALNQSELNPNEEQRLLSMADEVQKLRQMISKLLILSQADSGRLKISKERINLSQLVESVIADGDILAPDLSIKIKIEKDIMLDGDPIWLGQAFNNLFMNAIKYNREDGYIRIELKSKEKEAILILSNSGAKIPETSSKMIFERFYRADPSHNSKKEGSGLGLSLALEFVKAHGGTLELSQNVKDHIEFRLTLPLISES